MGVVQLRQIKNHLDSHFSGYVDISDLSGRADDHKCNALLSRSLAAFAISIDTDLEPEKAAAIIVDGFDDNGIDAAYYSPGDKTLFLGQAKWSNDGTTIIDQASAEKFIRGVQDLLNLRFDRFNVRVNRRKSELDAAINSATRIVLIVAASGIGKMGDHPSRSLAACRS